MIYISQLINLSPDERRAAGRNMRPYSVTVDRQSVGTIPIAVTTAGKQVNFRSPNYGGGASVFECTEFVFSDQTDTTALNNCTFLMQDYAGRRFTNAPIHCRTMFGTGRLPGVLKEPIIMPARDMISAFFTKISGGTVNIRPYLNGVVYGVGDGSSQLCKEQIKLLTERYRYFWPNWTTFDNGAPTLTANSTNNQFDVRIGDNTEFFTLAAISTGDFSMSIEEVDSGTTLMNGKISQGSAIGDARYPTMFEAQYMLPAGTRLRFSLDELSGSTNTVYITLNGRSSLYPLAKWVEMENASKISLPMWNEDRLHLGAA